MNYSEIKYCDIANGPGCRTSLFVSGCNIRCKGCFNAIAWDFNNGKLFTPEVLENQIIKPSRHNYISGLSILGGEPLDERNIKDVYNAILRFKEEYPHKDVWLWTGYKYEDLRERLKNHAFNTTKYSTYLHDILINIAVLVDGPFEEDKKALGLRFRGSSNQRLIDMKKSIGLDEPVLWHDDKIFDTHQWEQDYDN